MVRIKSRSIAGKKLVNPEESRKLPAGKYVAFITGDGIGKLRRGGDYLWFEFRTVAGEAGDVVRGGKINLFALRSEDAPVFAKDRDEFLFDSLMHACYFGDRPLEDTEQLHRLPFGLTVGYKDKDKDQKYPDFEITQLPKESYNAFIETIRNTEVPF